jgi:hypothetical protein
MERDFWTIFLSLLAVGFCIVLYRVVRDTWPGWPAPVQSLWFILAALGATGLPITYYWLVYSSRADLTFFWFSPGWLVAVLITFAGTAVVANRSQQR